MDNYRISTLFPSDPEKHKNITQSKFDIFFLHKPFSGFFKILKITTDLKKNTETWFTGLHVFPGLYGGH